MTSIYYGSADCYTPGSLPNLPLMDKISEAAPLCFIKNDDSQLPLCHGLKAPKAIGLVIYFVNHAVDIKLLKVKLKFQSKDLKRTFSICWCRLFSISPAASGYPWHWEASHSRAQPPLWMPRQAEHRDYHIIISRLKPEFHLTS